MDYMLKRWDSFTRFLVDGRICLTNNAAERELRGITLGSKSWLFAGSDRGGERTAVMYTLIQTAKLNDVDPPGMAGRRAGPHQRSQHPKSRSAPAVELEGSPSQARCLNAPLRGSSADPHAALTGGFLSTGAFLRGRWKSPADNKAQV
jgi:Transposase IS66 family